MNSKHYVIFLRISALFVCAWFVSHDDAHIKQYIYIRFLCISTLYVCAWFVDLCKTEVNFLPIQKSLSDLLSQSVCSHIERTSLTRLELYLITQRWFKMLSSFSLLTRLFCTKQNTWTLHDLFNVSFSYEKYTTLIH